MDAELLEQLDKHSYVRETAPIARVTKTLFSSLLFNSGIRVHPCCQDGDDDEPPSSRKPNYLSAPDETTETIFYGSCLFELMNQ